MSSDSDVPLMLAFKILTNSSFQPCWNKDLHCYAQNYKLKMPKSILFNYVWKSDLMLFGLVKTILEDVPLCTADMLLWENFNKTKWFFQCFLFSDPEMAYSN